jgi:ATP-dependent helicase/nuclease subunit A
MTRAEKWLIVAAAGDLSKDGSDWYQITALAMSHINGLPHGSDGTLRFEEGHWGDLDVVEKSRLAAVKPVLEPIFNEVAPTYCVEEKHLSPSDLGGAKALQGELGSDKDTALIFGSLVHDLIDKLGQVPPSDRSTALQNLNLNADAEMITRATDEALGVLNDPDFADLFAATTLAEVPITAHIADKAIYGIIDRLQITDGTIMVIDYKTNRVVPQDAAMCPEGILRQMGAYAEMVGQIYPNHTVNTAILWTATRSLMHLPHDLVTNALRSTPYLDARPTGS